MYVPANKKDLLPREHLDPYISRTNLFQAPGFAPRCRRMDAAEPAADLADSLARPVCLGGPVTGLGLVKSSLHLGTFWQCWGKSRLGYVWASASKGSQLNTRNYHILPFQRGPLIFGSMIRLVLSELVLQYLNYAEIRFASVACAPNGFKCVRVQVVVVSVPNPSCPFRLCDRI